jgi:thiamine kinase-like enzyme
MELFIKVGINCEWRILTIMNNINQLCKKLDLGTALKPATKVHGSLLHRMWKVETTKSSYAIKQLSDHIDFKDEAVRNNYELTEKIARLFVKDGIPAIAALEKLTEIDGTYFLVYPWVEAAALDKDAISENHALQIAPILAKMHLLNLSIPEIEEPVFDVHTNGFIINLAEKSPISIDTETLLLINDAYLKSIPILKQHSVISHGDLDQKNVLWDKNGTPILIDWESARKVNPTYEIVNESLNWSGITTEFDKELFIKMLNAYVAAGGTIDKTILEAALYGVLGNWLNWLNWLLYNIKRASSDSENKMLGIEQIEQVQPTMFRLYKLIPELMTTLVKEL